MSIKKNFSLVIMDPEKIADMNHIIEQHARITMKSSSPLFFDKRPINSSQIFMDITFFQLECKNEGRISEKLEKIIEKLNGMNTDYYIRDEETGELIVEIEFGGELHVKFNRLERIKQGTFKKIDALKLVKHEYGYCKGFKPIFRPVEEQPIDEIFIQPEIIYLFSPSSENLSKLKDWASGEILKIDPDLEIEFKQY